MPQSSTLDSLSLSSKPRVWLTDALLARLRQRAAAGDAAWKTLAARCDADASGTANVPSAQAYPAAPDIGQGYEGDGYLPEILALGLCYQTAAGVDSASATRWGAGGRPPPRRHGDPRR